MDRTFLARRNSSGYTLLVDGVQFGAIVLRGNTVVGGTFKDDEVREAHSGLYVNRNNPEPKTLADHLAFARRAYELVAKERERAIKAERARKRDAERDAKAKVLVGPALDAAPDESWLTMLASIPQR